MPFLRTFSESEGNTHVLKVTGDALKILGLTKNFFKILFVGQIWEGKLGRELVGCRCFFLKVI